MSEFSQLNFSLSFAEHASATNMYLTQWNKRVTPLWIYGSAKVGDLDISAGALDLTNTTAIESSNATGNVQLGVVNACTNAAPSTNTIVCATAAFVFDGVSVGDIVKNVTTGKYVRITDVVSDTELTVSGSETHTAADDIEVYKTSYTTVKSSTATYVSNSVYPGCICHNVTTGEKMRVASVESETELTVDSEDGIGLNDLIKIYDPITWTVVASRTYGAAETLNDELILPAADVYKIELSGGGKLTCTYKITE